MADVTLLIDLFWRAGTFGVILAWLLASTRWLLYFAAEIHGHWGTWHTFPLPSKRATKHLVYLLLIISVDLLFTAFALWWFLG